MGSWKLIGMPHAAGDILAGRYRIDAVLGSGGMGSVYRATQLALDKPFAVKEMLVEIPNPRLRTAAIEQFRVEARILHTLEHPGLPRLYDFFEEEGRYYLVMELVRGTTIDVVVSDTPCSEAQLLRWLHELCAVLHYLHTHEPQVVFRDLKPSNIMLNADGHLKLIDFGIAKVWDAQDEDTLTRTGVRGMCTPGYAAPEQYGTGTDSRTDIYALGATAYSLLTCTVPPPSVDMASGRADLPSLKALRPDVSDNTVRCIESLMQLSMMKRPQSIQEVMDAFGFSPFMTPLDAAPQTSSRFWLGSNLTQLTPGMSRTLKRRRTPGVRLWAAAGGGALLVGVLGFALLHVHRHPQARGPLTVEVQASVDNTRVTDGSRFLGDAGLDPASVLLSPGSHRLSFEHAGYQSEVMSVQVQTDGSLVDAQGSRLDHVYARLAPKPGRVSIRGVKGARVTIDGQGVGSVPYVSKPMAALRPHSVEVSRPGYKSRTRTVMLQPEQTLALDMTQAALPVPKLPPPAVHHVVQAPSHATVHHRHRFHIPFFH